MDFIPLSHHVSPVISKPLMYLPSKKEKFEEAGNPFISPKRAFNWTLFVLESIWMSKQCWQPVTWVKIKERTDTDLFSRDEARQIYFSHGPHGKIHLLSKMLILVWTCTVSVINAGRNHDFISFILNCANDTWCFGQKSIEWRDSCNLLTRFPDNW